MKKLVWNLGELLKKRKIKLTEFARVLNMNRATVHSLINNKSTGVKFNTIERI